jgi:1-acyl-sn-glycerol-3-phosphate acyltransferase
MEQWRYDPTIDFDPALLGQIRRYHEPNRLVCGMRTLSAAVLRGWLHLYHRLRIIGRENLPLDRSFILVANHASHLDTLCLLAALPMRRLHDALPVAARDYFCGTALRSLLARIVVNALPFDRQFAPWQSLSLCAHLLENRGTVLIFFPEGTRSSGAVPGEFKAGVALLAAGHDLPIVPCHLAGTHAALPKGACVPRPRSIRLAIGEPRVYAHLPPTKESALHICRELREVVIRLGEAEPEGKPTPRARAVEPCLQMPSLDGK